MDTNTHESERQPRNGEGIESDYRLVFHIEQPFGNLPIRVHSLKHGYG